MARDITFSTEYELMRAVNKLGTCLVALDDANQSLRPELPKCSNGITIDVVYFGVRETLEDIRNDLDAVWKTL